ncbi:MAG: TetR/AcrR family transcriptional regulator [bacterium]|nr:TetR/AcrR family transcriptional regulator [bacterium]
MKSRKYSTRQREIAECARRIIVTKGIERLTIREIAKDLNLTDGALYRHFKSKNEIIGLLIEDIENTLLNTIEKAAKKANNPLVKLMNIFLSHISYAEQRKGVTFIVINETLSLQDKLLRNKMSDIIQKYLKKIEEILIDGVLSEKFRKNIDTASASIAFFGMVQSLVTIWALSGYKYSLREKHIQNCFEIYKKGIVS